MAPVPSTSTNMTGNNSHQSTATGSPSHHIPFHSTNHQPSQLGFGFGFGSSFSSPSNPTSNPSTSLQWGSNPTTNSFGQSSSSSFALPAPLLSSSATNQAHPPSNSSTSPWKSATPRKQDAKRRRDDEDDEPSGDVDEDMSMGGRSTSGSPGPSRERDNQRFGINSQGRQMLPKRMRAGLGTGLDDNSKINGLSGLGSGRNTKTGVVTSGMGSPSAFAISGGVGINANGKEKERREEEDASGVDLGKMLASLDKPALLSLLHSLLATSTDSKLPSQIISLLPAPSLESVDAALDEAERAIRQALPWGNGARDEYTWSRVRNVLLEFVNLAISYGPFFVPKSKDLSISSTSNSSNHGINANSKRADPHPASTFAFLQSVTVRLLRIESALPTVPRTVFSFNTLNSSSKSSSSSSKDLLPGSEASIRRALIQLLPTDSTAGGRGSGEALLSPSSPDSLISILAPTLLSHWNTLITNLSVAVNQEGRMFGKDVVMGWGRSLAAMGMSGATTSTSSHSASSSTSVNGLKGEERAIRMVMDNVREKFERELGWLVATPSFSNSANIHQGSSGFGPSSNLSIMQQQQVAGVRNPTMKRERQGSSVGMEEEEL